MSVLISGIALPECCGVCPCCHSIYVGVEYRGAYCEANKDPYNNSIENTRAINANCPLIEVPEDRLFYVHDNVLYEATVKMPEGKTIKIPPIKTESEDE